MVPASVAARRLDAIALALAAAVLLPLAFLFPATAYGDGGEYLLMAESLFRHGTPHASPPDLQNLAIAPPRGVYRLLAGYAVGRNGGFYSIHFWAYPALVLPAKAFLHVLHVHDLKSFQLTNAVLFLAALGHVLLLSPLPAFPRRALAVLLVFSPALWFIVWPHPEVFSFAFVTSALVFRHQKRWLAAVLCASIASLQNAPLVLFAGLVWLEGAVAAVRQGRATAGSPARRIGWLSLALCVAAAPFAFYLAFFGTPSLIARDAAKPANLSLQRMAELLFDPNIGMLPFVPVALLLALAAGLRAFWRRDHEPLVIWLALLAMALACTTTDNWNHGTSGPSRYTIWLLPFVFWLATLPAAEPRRVAWRALCVLAVLVQAMIVVARGGPIPRVDYVEHSRLARLLLDHRPSLYNPTPDIFAKRTAHAEIEVRHPIIYRHDGHCRKVLLQRRHLPAVREACGGDAANLEHFLARVKREGRETWGYLDF